MASFVQRLSAMLGKMQYNRWVLLARHEQEFGRRSSMLLTNAAFMGMLGFIVLDAAQHSRQHENLAYVQRKMKVMKAVEEHWDAEKSLHELDVDELEESVFRARKHEQHASLDAKDAAGNPIVWHKTTMVSVPLPIKSLEEFAPEGRA